MAHVDVPKDLNGIKTTFALWLSWKQFVVCCVGLLITVIFTGVLRSLFEFSLFTAFLFSSIHFIPLGFVLFYKKNGMSFAQVSKVVIRHKVLYKSIMIYKNENFYNQLSNPTDIRDTGNNLSKETFFTRDESLNGKNSKSKTKYKK